MIIETANSFERMLFANGKRPIKRSRVAFTLKSMSVNEAGNPKSCLHRARARTHYKAMRYRLVAQRGCSEPTSSQTSRAAHIGRNSLARVWPSALVQPAAQLPRAVSVSSWPARITRSADSARRYRGQVAYLLGRRSHRR